MKKSLLICLLIVFLATTVLAKCELDVQLVNQDPYPAVPGDYVKLLFQVSGVESPDCGEISLQLLENYPLKFDPGFDSIKKFESGTFARGYSSNWIVPYTVRVDSEALDGDAEIEVLYSTKGVKSFKISKLFDLKIEEVKVDFDIFIRNYNYANKRLTLEVLNVGKNDINSVIITIPSQENIKVYGGKRNLIGDLDSNDYTSTDFEATPSEGKIILEIEYTDKIGERRKLEKEIYFEPHYFEHTIPDNGKMIQYLSILGVLFIVFILWRVFRKKKKKVF
jgi:hypothetical protein